MTDCIKEHTKAEDEPSYARLSQILGIAPNEINPDFVHGVERATKTLNDKGVTFQINWQQTTKAPSKKPAVICHVNAAYAEKDESVTSQGIYSSIQKDFASIGKPMTPDFEKGVLATLACWDTYTLSGKLLFTAKPAAPKPALAQITRAMRKGFKYLVRRLTATP